MVLPAGWTTGAAGAGPIRGVWPGCPYLQGCCQALRLHQRFDVIILSDLVNDLWDAQTVLENLAGMVHPRSRIILNSYSRSWELPLSLAQRLGLAKPSPQQKRFTTGDPTRPLRLTGIGPHR